MILHIVVILGFLMPVKILTSTLVGLDEFYKNPMSELLQADRGTLAVLDNNKTMFYVLTPQRLTYLLELETTVQKLSDDSLNKNLFKNNISLTPHSIGKFAMYHTWRPDEDFQYQAAIWGIALKEPITNAELTSFITYWEAEGCLFHHVQWQQKLARYIQMNRNIKKKQLKPDRTQIINTNYEIPDGFRGE